MRTDQIRAVRKRANLAACEIWHGNPTAVRWDEQYRTTRWWVKIASKREYRSLYLDNFIVKRGYADEAETEVPKGYKETNRRRR